MREETQVSQSSNKAIRDRRHGSSIAVLLTALSAVVAVLLIAATGASAQETRLLESSFGGGELSLASQSGVAINNLTHNVYVADTGHGRVSEFEADGTPIRTFGTLSSPTFIAVDNSGGGSQGSVYVLSSGDNTVAKFNATGTLETSWGTGGKISNPGAVAGIAVGSAGTLYILEESSIIRVFNSAGVAQPEITAPRGTAANGLALDSAGDLYKVDGSLEVTKFDTTGATLSDNLTGRTDAAGLNVDPSNDRLYVVHSNNGTPFIGGYENGCGENCQPAEVFGEGELTSATAVALGSGNAYVADAGADQIDIFGPVGTAPDVTVREPTDVKARGATLHGTVNPLGIAVTDCVFEYAIEGHPFSSAPCEESIPVDEGEHQVKAAVEGLIPNSSYELRLVAKNANGKSVSRIERFETLTPVVTGPATGLTASSAILTGTVAPEGEAVTECYFEYGTTSAYGSTVPCEGAIPTDENGHPVEAHISGLSREQSYSFRLVMRQASGIAIGSGVGFTTAGARINGEHAVQIGTHEATFEFNLNPEGSSAQYYFEYGPTTAYGQSTPITLVSAGEEPLPIAETVTGLEIATTYHWRLVVTEKFGTIDRPDHTFATQLAAPAIEGSCPNEALRAGPGAGLPDCRAYEQASPVDKNGDNVEGFEGLLSASEDGSSVTYYSQAATGIPAGGGAHQQFPTYLSTRGAANWSTQRLLPPEALGQEAGYLGSTANNHFALVQASPRQPKKTGLYLIDTETEAVTTIVPPTARRTYAFDGGSADGSRIYFETNSQLLPNAAEEEVNLYEWSRATGQLSVVGVLPGPGEEVPSGGSFGGPYEWFAESNTSNGGSFANLYVEANHALTSDGSQIYFTAGGTGQLYLRKGLDGSSPTTLHVSEPASGVNDPLGPKPAAFQEATPNGNLVFFTSSEKLTSDATTGPSDDGNDLYVWSENGQEMRDVAPDTNDPNGAEVQGLIGAASDGRSGFFVARGSLAGDAVRGEYNLYHFQEKSNGQFEIRFVVALAKGGGAGENDSRDWSPQAASNPGAGTLSKQGRVDASGQTVIFMSFRSLTGYNNGARYPNGFGGLPVTELYRYSMDEEHLDCISCNRTEETPKGPAELTPPFINAYLEPSQGKFPATLTRNLSADGDQVFFESPDPLVSSDVNGRKECKFYNQYYGGHPDCEDVYEWEAVGTPGGSCSHAEVSGGCLYLLSTGQSLDPSYFIGASADGSTAFIVTTSGLVPADMDELFDAYAVRVDGGLPAQFAAAAVKCSSDESCKGPAAEGSPPEARGSSTFVGPGNPKPKAASKCKKKKSKNGKKKSSCSKHKKKSKKKSKKNGKGRTAKSGKKGGTK